MENLLNTGGRIFNIQRFSIHDGPGIRTIVFFKGCSLRCRWCCNPESQNFEIETLTEAGKPKTVGRDVTVREVLAEAQKDKPYYARSGGGLTLSGGEAFCQPDFAFALLKAAHDEGYNTAVETAGFYPFKNIEKSLPYIDNVLMDIKCVNSEKHKEFIGRPNELILENAKKISAAAKNMVVRVPVIPGFNDSEEEILRIARFAASLQNVKEVHLLPYHRLGSDKYAGLGRQYLLEAIEPPGAAKMNYLKEVVNRAGLNCRIGG